MVLTKFFHVVTSCDMRVGGMAIRFLWKNSCVRHLWNTTHFQSFVNRMLFFAPVTVTPIGNYAGPKAGVGGGGAANATP